MAADRVGPPPFAPASWQEILMAPFLDRLTISGVSLSVVGFGRQESTICESDTTAAQISEIQFALGEGPHWEALRTGLPIVVPDVMSNGERWPMFAEALAALPVAAVFAFPLRIGAVVVGVADLYRSVAGSMPDTEVAIARDASRAAAGVAVRRATQSANDHQTPAGSPFPETRREVQQATGMILAQLNVTATEAFFRLKTHAFVTGQSIQVVAHDVVSRQLNFRDLIE